MVIPYGASDMAAHFRGASGDAEAMRFFLIGQCDQTSPKLCKGSE